MKRKEKVEDGLRGKPVKKKRLSPLSLSPPPTIAVVGAGRLGTALAIALASRGYRIEAVVARRLGRARRAAALIDSHIDSHIDGQTRALSSAVLERLPPADITYITTPDDEIQKVAARLATIIKGDGRGRTVLHASGALSSDVLNCLRAAGCETGSMHPLISVSDSLSGAQSLRRAFYCIEGTPVARRVARQLVRALGGRSFSINTRDKALYHAAAVMSSGHLVALFDIATEMLRRCGLTDKQSRAALLPLVLSTVENLSQQRPARALTGTFARADAATVQRHLAALRAPDTDDALAAYVLLAERSLKLAEQNGANIESVNKIKRALKKTRRRR